MNLPIDVSLRHIRKDYSQLNESSDEYLIYEALLQLRVRLKNEPEHETVTAKSIQGLSGIYREEVA